VSREVRKLRPEVVLAETGAAGGPKVLLGAWSKLVPKRVADYCDGWIPGDVGVDLGSCIEVIRAKM